jgi:hypothetical protein
MGSGQENQVIALWRDLGMTQQKPIALAGVPEAYNPELPTLDDQRMTGCPRSVEAKYQ